MAKILITGHKGTIGSVIVQQLSDHHITGVDLPEIDLTDYQQLAAVMPDHHVLIHLAWNQDENPWSGTIHTDNLVMTMNIFRAAIEFKVAKVILASSVHTDNFYTHQPGDEPLHPHQPGTPTSPYGASKHFVETLGRLLATLGPEVVAIRLGGVTKDDRPDYSIPGEADVWLSQRDAGSLMVAIIQTPTQPHRFTHMYAVSHQKNQKHRTDNPFGWQPQDQLPDDGEA